jgi:hypothetical protein
MKGISGDWQKEVLSNMGLDSTSGTRISSFFRLKFLFP